VDREDMSMDDLICHTLKALHATIQDGDLNERNCSVAVVGKGQPFTILEGESLGPFLATVLEEEELEEADDVGSGGGGGGGGGGEEMIEG
jgi:20S proteasome alpha/beta subunit